MAFNFDIGVKFKKTLTETVSISDNIQKRTYEPIPVIYLTEVV